MKNFLRGLADKIGRAFKRDDVGRYADKAARAAVERQFSAAKTDRTAKPPKPRTPIRNALRDQQAHFLQRLRASTRQLFLSVRFFPYTDPKTQETKWRRAASTFKAGRNAEKRAAAPIRIRGLKLGQTDVLQPYKRVHLERRGLLDARRERQLAGVL